MIELASIQRYEEVDQFVAEDEDADEQQQPCDSAREVETVIVTNGSRVVQDAAEISNGQRRIYVENQIATPTGRSRLGHQEHLLINGLVLSFLIALSVAIGGNWKFGAWFFPANNSDNHPSPTLSPFGELSFLGPTPPPVPKYVPNYFPICTPPQTTMRNTSSTASNSSNSTFGQLLFEQHIHDGFRKRAWDIYMSGDASMLVYPRPMYPDTVCGGTIHKGCGRGIIKIYAWSCENSDGYQPWGPPLEGKNTYVNHETQESRFGVSIAIDANGTTLAVASRNLVEVYKRRSDGWEQCGYLLLERSTDQHFGATVALTPDGEWVAVLDFSSHFGGISLYIYHVLTGQNDKYETMLDAWDGYFMHTKLSITSLSNGGLEILAVGRTGVHMVQYFQKNGNSWFEINSENRDDMLSNVLRQNTIGPLHEIISYSVSYRRLAFCAIPVACFPHDGRVDPCFLVEWDSGNKRWTLVYTTSSGRYGRMEMVSNLVTMSSPDDCRRKIDQQGVVLLRKNNASSWEMTEPSGGERNDAVFRILPSQDGTMILVVYGKGDDMLLSKIALYRL